MHYKHPSIALLISLLPLCDAFLIAKRAAAAERACCNTLAASLGSKVAFQNNTQYLDSLSSYWAQQETQVTPACIVEAASTEDVAKAVGLLSLANRANGYQCKFAIRSGGHGSFGASTERGGINIDLSAMKSIQLNSNKTLTSIQPGAKWEDVYGYLDSFSLTVAGGRAAGVGVGGLSLGGGVSYLSPRVGFVCDNIVNLEIVLASGKVINANVMENADLLLALRGGGNNFGIVTRLDLETFPQGDLWASSVIYPITTAEQNLQSLYQFTADPAYDENASIIQSFGFGAALGTVAVNAMVYAAPVANASALRNFTNIQPQLFKAEGIVNMTTVTINQGANSPPGFRQLMATTTVVNNYDMLVEVFQLWNATLPSVQNVSNLTWAWSNEPLPTAILSKSGAVGGNSLGLNASTPPLMLGLLTASWTGSVNDGLIHSVAHKLIDDIETSAKKKGAYHRFKYLNYAAPWQRNVNGYGEDSKRHLLKVSREYDPDQIFSMAVPGGFKLTSIPRQAGSVLFGVNMLELSTV